MNVVSLLILLIVVLTCDADLSLQEVFDDSGEVCGYLESTGVEESHWNTAVGAMQLLVLLGAEPCSPVRCLHLFWCGAEPCSPKFCVCVLAGMPVCLHVLLSVSSCVYLCLSVSVCVCLCLYVILYLPVCM